LQKVKNHSNATNYHYLSSWAQSIIEQKEKHTPKTVVVVKIQSELKCFAFYKMQISNSTIAKLFLALDLLYSILCFFPSTKICWPAW